MQNLFCRTAFLVVSIAVAAYAQVPQSVASQSLVEQLRLTNPSNSSLQIFPNTIASFPLSGVSQEWVARYDKPGNADDFATIRYSRDGDERWVARYDGMTGNDDDPADIFGRSGNIYVTGSGPSDLNDQDLDYATVKYDANGVEQWADYYDGKGIAISNGFGEVDEAEKILQRAIAAYNE